jgi:hypothetical protein
MQLVAVVEKALRSAPVNGDQEPDDNRGDMDEEALPRVNRFMGSANIKHRR